MIVFWGTIIILTIILLFFVSPKLSPVPYFPTNSKDLSILINLLIKSYSKKPKNIIDFGAGDGRVIFEAAKKAYEKNLSLKLYAIEINPVLIFILHLRRFFHPYKKNIHILWGDMFKIKVKDKILNPKNRTIIYLYISPWLMDKLLNHLKSQLSPFKEITFISYFYPIKNLAKKRKVIHGVNKIYVYEL